MHSLNINKKISKIMAAVIIAGSLTAFAGNNTVMADEISDIAVVSETTETRAAAKNGFVKEGNKTYYYKNGNKVKGWVEANGEKYYFMNNFEMAQSRYRTIKDVDYFFKADGTLAANEVVKTTDGIFRFNADGTKVANEKYAEVVNCDFLTVRAASNAKAEEKGKLNPGTLIKITGEANGWNRIETADGEKGWVNADYLNYNEPVNAKVQKVISVAKAQMGKPYRWGATGPSSFDCSGLMQYAFKNGAGVSLPRVSRDQANVGKKVSKAELQPGDLVFFAKGGRIHHVGMYLGNDQYIHAPQTGDVVKISKLSSRTLYTARRVIQ
ncbi:NlpC/P60 family protein [Peptoclostridium sp. AF21-18]|uniref:NlpC/P60 family protein n=1 Tax=Peptoclostridium sp. AF21-18 TaxID=2292243 RepID=UPI002570A520|nr:NlpC/P60 family protein [Peptoclostridium sp. AF21-18]